MFLAGACIVTCKLVEQDPDREYQGNRFSQRIVERVHDYTNDLIVTTRNVQKLTNVNLQGEVKS